MATSFSFEGKNIKIPGSYSTIKSGQKNPPVDLDFGTVLIIDTGSGAGYGGGAGINGTLASGKDAIYIMNDVEEMQNFAKGGLWYLLANPLFRPAGLGVDGVSSVLFARAASTNAAEFAYTFVGGGANGGNVQVQVRDEGLIGNASIDATPELRKGYAAIMEAGVVDTAKFIIKFYRGTYTGLDQNGLPFNEVDEGDAAPILLAETPEFDNMQEVIDYMNEDFTFNTYFKLKTSSVAGTGAVDAADLAANLAYNPAAGGTETYSTSALTDVLDEVADLNISFIFADDFGNDAQSANNFKIANHIVDDSQFKPELYIAAGSAIGDFAQSQLDAAFWDSDFVTVVHGGIQKASRRAGVGFKNYDSYYKAALMLGREAGLEPQVPLTFKDIDIDGEVHPLNDKEVVIALDAGLLVSRLEGASFDIVKGVNSLQKNTFLVNDDGTIHSKQIKRIARQINKELIVNSKEQLLKDPSGVNRNTLSELDVQKWTEGYLTRKIAVPTADNLILTFQEVVVTREQDAYKITYKFTPNSEISFLFFTGFIVNV